LKKSEKNWGKLATNQTKLLFGGSAFRTPEFPGADSRGPN
jgi:hypothetical protein